MENHALPTENEAEKIFTESRESFAKKVFSCYLCGHTLDIFLEHISFTRFAVEKTHCPKCEVITRVENHSIQ